MANKKSFPSYYGLRIYLSSSILYFFLIMPFLGFLAAQSVPGMMKDRKPESDFARGMVDAQELPDSLSGLSGEQKLDSIMAVVEDIGTMLEDTAAIARLEALAGDEEEDKSEEEEGGINFSNDTDGPFNVYFALLTFITLAAYLAGLFYNRPFKRYFKKRLRGRDISERHHGWCKKQLLRTPVTNALILTFPMMVGIVFAIVYLIGGQEFGNATEQKLFRQFSFLIVVATLLEFLFIYYWQKHRVHLRYLEHVFSPEELKGNIFRGKRGRIKNRLALASGMTTFLPLLIVMVYLVLSLSSVSDLGISEFSDQQREILIGPWHSIIGENGEGKMELFNKLSYVNAIDSIIMLVGIGSGILVSLVYILLFIRWTNEDITRPVRELQAVIRSTRGDDAGEYCIVRSNDEIGELAEGYNEMTGKIHSYVESISALNRDLEKKVKERTNEVVQQKEEIEAQKEEIEAQLDLTTEQKNTIFSQNEQILDSIRYAERIQSAMLPPLDMLEGAISDHFVLFRPRDIVSGDYYWIARDGERILMAVADCTGHGVPGALLSMMGISAMNEVINRHKGLAANEILTRLREQVIASLHQKGSSTEARDGIEIALIIFDPKSMMLQFAGANRPMYLLNAAADNAGNEDAISIYRADRMPIGIYEQDPLPFTLHETEVKEGDRIYLFSDGFVDQLGGPGRKTFRAGRFRRILADMHDINMQEQKDILENRFLAWKGDVEQIDDVLVVGLQV